MSFDSNYGPPGGLDQYGSGAGFGTGPGSSAMPFQMQYWRSYSYVFEHPDWIRNVIFIIICQFIPVVGPLVLLGYQFDVVESLLRGNPAPYMAFDFNRFVEYLTRGLWPFLVGIVVAIVLVPLVYIVFIGLFFGGAALVSAVGEDAAGPMIAVFGTLGFIFYFAFLIGINMILQPMFLAAGITQEFNAAFNLTYVRTFLQMAWKEMLLGGLFLMFSGMLCAFGGMLVCFVGVYFSAVLIAYAQAYMYYQLYCVYLSRGGAPLPFKT